MSKQQIQEFLDSLVDGDSRLAQLEDFIVNHLGDDNKSEEPQVLVAFSPDDSPIIGSYERIQGVALISGFDPQTRDPIYTGQTNVYWDSQKTELNLMLEPTYVDDNGQTWALSTLRFEAQPTTPAQD